MSMEEAKEFLVRHAGEYCNPSVEYEVGSINYNRIMCGFKRYSEKLRRFDINIMHRKSIAGKLFYMVKEKDIKRMI